MRVIFMGTPAFAVPTLAMLLSDHEVLAVYSRPDRPTGRGRRLSQPPVVQAAFAAGVEVRQPATLRGADAVSRLQADRPDVIVVAAYGAILPPGVLAVPRHGCLNVHASLLPRWRGAAPVQRAILAGDTLTGVSVMRMEEGLDTGPWCLQETVPVDARTADDLTGELAVVGAAAMRRALEGLAAGSLEWHDQDERQATYAAKVTRADVALDPTITVQQALARVRASGPSAPCRVAIMGRSITVLSAHRHDGWVVSGMASCERELVLGVADGAIRLDAIVPEGRSAMSAEAYVRGARLHGGCEWGQV
ncbi:MAG TPA: methionyl-tRNA formyltransferase [Coriobacteriia bacterium]